MTGSARIVQDLPESAYSYRPLIKTFWKANDRPREGPILGFLCTSPLENGFFFIDFALHPLFSAFSGFSRVPWKKRPLFRVQISVFFSCFFTFFTFPTFSPQLRGALGNRDPKMYASPRGARISGVGRSRRPTDQNVPCFRDFRVFSVWLADIFQNLCHFFVFFFAHI